MKRSPRLHSDERRQAIVGAVRTLFAEKGFDGTKTRELAKAAGVSEALIYKHFPSKESLYAAMLEASAKGPLFAEFNRILALDPSVATLAVMVHFTISYYAHNHQPEKAATNALMVRSLLADGGYARLTYQKYADAWTRKFEACIKQAVKANALQTNDRRGDLSMWFVQHIGFSLMLHRHPAVPAIQYKASEETLVEQATLFALRGLGLKEEVIERHYNPKVMALLAG
ncbi:MAG: TetR/AcrR family transcriptional regulator [Deltaproteobacteria bacterium]|nr:TetR/AcrR family transcriptional regulator [Deltaproteobacteria bacterium]